MEAHGTEGLTPLAVAVSNSHYAVAERLISAGADVHTSRKTGESMLIHAVVDGNVATVEFLLRHGLEGQCQSALAKATDLRSFDVLKAASALCDPVQTQDTHSEL